MSQGKRRKADRSSRAREAASPAGQRERKTGRPGALRGRARRLLAAIWSRQEVRIASVTCVICLIGFAVLIRLESDSLAVTGKLQYSGNVTVQFRDSQHLAISPVCGCYRPRVGRWRGISFAGTDLRIRREGTTERTSFLVTAPQPSLTTWLPSYLRVLSDIYSFSLPFDSVFSPDSLLSTTWLNSHPHIKHSYHNLSDFALVSAKPLGVHMAGKAPLGAWIPAEGSTVVLSYDDDAVGSEEAHARIEEQYVPYTGGIEGDIAPYVFKTPMGFPLGDFLGPNVILWTDDPSAIIRVSDDARQDSSLLSPPVAGQRHITAVVATSAFAIRVAVSPLGEWWERENARHPIWPGEPRDSGKVFVELLTPQIPEAEYQSIYEWVRANELTSVPTHLGTENQLTSLMAVAMSFRYPPVPNNAGFNVFGALSFLRFDWTDGEMNVGTQTQPLVSTPLELRGIDTLLVRDAKEAVPLRLHLPDGQAEFNFQAKSEVSINGEHPGMAREKTLQTLSVVFGLLGLITAVVSTVYAGIAMHQSNPRGR